MNRTGCEPCLCGDPYCSRCFPGNGEPCDVPACPACKEVPMISPSDDLRAGGPVVVQANDLRPGSDLRPGDDIRPVVPQQPGVRECGCERLCGGLWACELHRPIVGRTAAERCGAIIVRAMLAAAGLVAAGAEPAAAVANVRDRWGI